MSLKQQEFDKEIEKHFLRKFFGKGKGKKPLFKKGVSIISSSNVHSA